MKKTTCLVLVIIMLGITGAAFAGDSKTIQIIAVIPAIPGVNAPIYVVNDLLDATSVDENKRKERSMEEEMPVFIVQDEYRHSSGNVPMNLVLRTMYPR